MKEFHIMPDNYNNNIINSDKGSISTKPRLSKEEVKNKLALILHKIAEYKSRGEVPPASLIADAFALCELYPFGDFLEKLKDITTMAYEAAKAAAENGTLAKDSWLISDARKEFDELFARDPSAALEQFFNNPDIIEDMETSKDIREGKFVSEERRQTSRIKAISAENVYKRAILAPVAALKAEIAKQQGNTLEQNKHNDKLAYFAHKELTNQAFIERKNIRQRERKSTDDHIVLKEDGLLIDNAAEHAARKIEQTIKGGLAAVGTAMTKTPEVIIDALEDRMEAVAEKVEGTKTAIAEGARVVIEKKAREEALVAVKETLEKKEEVQIEEVIVKHVVEQEREEIKEIFEDKVSHKKAQVQVIDDKEAKRLARAAKKKAKQPQENESHDSSQLRKVLRSHGTVSKVVSKSKIPSNTPSINNNQHGIILDK